MQEQPAVTTFLFTDIEGSTRLWEQQPERMREALGRHDLLVRAAIESRHGTLVKSTGDGVHAVFDDPLDAVMAIVDLQQQLQDPQATAGLELRLRCGLHAGVVERRDGDYFGAPVNRAARIMSVAHGGQALLSQAVAELVGPRLPHAVTLDNLGVARLRDLAQAERLYQVVHPALRRSFPPLRTLEAVPNNLPQQLTSFIGREREFAALTALLRRARVLTLTGTGGLGKTRMALQVAAGVLDDFSDGAWFVELAAIVDPRLVPQAVASALGVTEDAGRPVQEALVAHARERRCLVVLDNCEHLAQACATLVRQLILAGAGVKVLATSREPLHVAGEMVYALPVLPLPPAAAPDALMQAESARLFVERAVAVDPAFAVTRTNAAAIATICRRVDGIPLALELAAARVRALSVDTIAARLDDRFRLLTGGDRAGLRRQQTLRALIDWSHELLGDDERVLFRRLAVFAGTFTLEAAEAIATGDALAAPDLIDVLVRLVDKSLVEREAAGDRYRLLESIRHYAQERLDHAGETSALRDRHLRFHLALAEAARPQLTGPEQARWLARLDAERENFLAAHAWAGHAAADDLGLRLVTALRRYWIFRGLLGLGYRITCEALEQPRAGGATLARCDALFDAGQLGSYMGRYAEADRYLEASLDIARRFDDDERIAAVLQPLGLTSLGRGDFARAREYLQEGLARAERLGNPLELAGALNALAQVARAEGDFATAQPLYGRVLGIARDSGNREIVAVSLLNLAMVAIANAAPARARDMLDEVLRIVDEIGSRPVAQSLLEVAAGLCVSSGTCADAARLLGAAAAQAAETGLHRDPADEAFLAPLIAQAQRTLGLPAFEAAESAGRALGFADALAAARAVLDGNGERRGHAVTGRDGTRSR